MPMRDHAMSLKALMLSVMLAPMLALGACGADGGGAGTERLSAESSNEIALDTIRTERMVANGRGDAVIEAAERFLRRQGFSYGDALIVEGGEEPARLRLAEALAAPGRVVRVGSDKTDGKGVRLTLLRTVATPPTCGDWSDPPTQDFSNLPNGNFGCATQSNLARMVADPNDLAAGRSIGDRGFDAERMSFLIDSVRRHDFIIKDYKVTNQTTGGGQ